MGRDEKDPRQTGRARRASVDAELTLTMSQPARARFDLPPITGQDQEALDTLVRQMLTEVATEGCVHIPEDAKGEPVPVTGDAERALPGARRKVTRPSQRKS